jgi:7-carboxy-7-deazaguanine synthase
MEPEAILDEVLKLSDRRPILVTISGGNPAIQPMDTLLEIGHNQGFQFALETQGSVARPWFSDLDYLTISPKPPSSGMRTDWGKLETCIKLANSGPVTTLKVVIFDDTDYAYAQEVNRHFPSVPLYLQVGNHTPPQVSPEVDIAGLVERLSWLTEKVTTDGWNDATVLPQLHVLLWGNKRGV